MKKLILVFGIILIAETNVKAQEVKNTSFTTSIGPVVSFGHSYISNRGESVWKPSGALGVAAMMMKSNWGIGATLSASHEGYKQQFAGSDGTYRKTVDPTYLRFTPAFYATPGHFTSNVKPMLFVGPSIARRITEDHYMSNTNVGEQNNDHFAEGNEFKEWDFGAVGGLGVNAQVGSNTWLNVAGSYYHGFLDVQNGNENRNLRLDIGLMFGL